mmetsp:Transcript_48145/g.89418  ORF Transcript_48145/g.89418 Transcript_48145/m.89418 type:complete len:230 (+) Transcript_48145:648-1337(+)
MNLHLLRLCQQLLQSSDSGVSSYFGLPEHVSWARHHRSSLHAVADSVTPWARIPAHCHLLHSYVPLPWAKLRALLLQVSSTAPHHLQQPVMPVHQPRPLQHRARRHPADAPPFRRQSYDCQTAGRQTAAPRHLVSKVQGSRAPDLAVLRDLRMLVLWSSPTPTRLRQYCSHLHLRARPESASSRRDALPRGCPDALSLVEFPKKQLPRLRRPAASRLENQPRNWPCLAD